ncbi:MAG: chitobiase/beta-hexosaminidase C-terminal domain-containing protein, partial [Bacillota bacterium]
MPLGSKMSAYQRRGVEKGCLVSLAVRLLRKSVSRAKPKGALFCGPKRAPFFLVLLALCFVLIPGLFPRIAGAGMPGEDPGVLTAAYDSATAAAVYAPNPVAGEDLPGAVSRTVYRGAAGGAVRILFPVGEAVYLDVTPAAFPPETETLAFTITPVASGATGISFAVYLDTGGAALPAPVQLGLPAGETGVFLCRGERGWYRLPAQREESHLFAAVAGAGTYGVAAAAYLPAPPAGGFTGATLRLESAAGGEVWYTTDGSDPRVSATAVKYAGPVQ